MMAIVMSIVVNLTLLVVHTMQISRSFAHKVGIASSYTIKVSALSDKR